MSHHRVHRFRSEEAMVKQEIITLKTHQRSHWVDVTPDVQQVVTESGIAHGICTIISLHTTAGITINENADPDVERDFFKKLALLIPQEPFFRHSEGNSDSHIKASLMGLSTQVAITDRSLVLGTWQSIYFCEFDGPRSRRVSVTIIGA